jgi:UDP-2,3-diacylglucosamine pyrophosphatase LpxH
MSDLHLFSRYSDVSKILRFLSSIKEERLILVGDIIDGYKFKKRKAHIDSLTIKAIIEILNFPRLIYITGNHDDFLRENKCLLNGILVVDELIEENTLIMHGDLFDKSIDKYGKLGDDIYDFIEDVGAVLGVNLKKYAKKYSKLLMNHLLNWKELVYAYALEKNCYNVIVGHTHHGEIIKKEKGLYMNCGAWIKGEDCTYIKENNIFTLHKFL